jgi:hypothetical protein
MSLILLLLFYFPVWLPILVACVARRTPATIRIILALSGIASGIYARSIHAGISHASGHERGWAVLLIPFTTGALSFWLIFTGVATVCALHFIAVGRAISLPGILAFSLVLGSIVLGIFVVFPFLTSPLR